MTSDADGTTWQPEAPLPPELRRLLGSGFALAPAGANVIMQLSRLGIGHAIAESTLERGALTKHPIKRTRTTLAYIMIALFGTQHERHTVRQEVNAQHRQVHSGTHDSLHYDALDPALQLWVAACMFQGVLDAVANFVGPLDDETYALLLAHCSRFATTLQVRRSQWPKDRVAFDDYWATALGEIAMDDVTREYLRGIATLSFLPAPVAWAFGPSHRFLTVGFLPPPFRELLGYPWSSRHQQRFERVVSAAAALNRHLPQPLRECPLNLIERDARRRIAKGRAVL